MIKKGYYEAMLEKMKHIGILFSAEKDVDKLISLILNEVMDMVQCDAGSVYIVEENDGLQVLRFMKSHNRSIDFKFEDTILKMDGTSLAGYSAINKVSFISNDLSTLKEMGLIYNDYFDRTTNYHTQNMMVVPMLDIKNEVVGVLQLINKMEEGVIVPFDAFEEELVLAIASQAAILLERSLLYNSIKVLFENFVESMVLTIDKRDPTTSGHSLRVAHYVKELINAVNETRDGILKDTHFTEEETQEIYYASLLHDIGKIGVSEVLLGKRFKLSPGTLELIRYRFMYLKSYLQCRLLNDHISSEEKALLENADQYYQLIVKVNGMGYLSDEDEAILREMAEIQYEEVDGQNKYLLSELELENLLVKKGNLTSEERAIMQKHATYTYDILKDIPWPDYLKRIPRMSAAHHEKLDGSGYPNQLKHEEIHLEAKLIAVADVFEALTAIDRPYKRSISIVEAIAILREEAKKDHLDQELVELFIEEVINKKGQTS